MSQFESNLKKMYGEFSQEQKDWFRYELPMGLDMWLSGDFSGKQLSKNPVLIENYLNHEISISSIFMKPAGTLDNLMLALWCIRKCHGPIKQPTLYRLTKFKNPDNAKKVKFQIKDELKPMTSWTSNQDVVVEDRNYSDSDYILRLDNVHPKNILSSVDVLLETVLIVIRNATYFELYETRAIKPKGGERAVVKAKMSKLKGIDAWSSAAKGIRQYLHEKEFLVYLHPNESLNATVERKVEIPQRATKSKSKLKPKIAMKTKATPPKKIKVAPMPNPFESTIGGMNKFSPKEQVAMAQKMYDATPKTPNNRDRLMHMADQLDRMRNYAEEHSIPI